MPDEPMPASAAFPAADRFADRHVGPGESDRTAMLAALGLPSLGALVDRAVPKAIRLARPLDLPAPLTEAECLAELSRLASLNRPLRSFIGLGYSGSVTPPVIQRNILENPGWYTQYTPYQPEISQGRLEALLNFQTLVCDLTGLEVANASLLDEGTAAAEAMTLLHRVREDASRDSFFVADGCHPQTIEVVRTRAEPLGLRIVLGDPERHDFGGGSGTFGALVQYPTTDGVVLDLAPFVSRARAAGARVVVATDLLALALLRPPGEFGADVAVGNSQRFGVPLLYGGPHAAFLATREEYVRKLPGRMVGVSRDSAGKKALRLALQTREQHIRRDKATSNICTAQVLLAVVASMYAVWHGPDGLRRIARRVAALSRTLARALSSIGCRVKGDVRFDTLRATPARVPADRVLAAARERGLNLRAYEGGDVGVALDQTATLDDVRTVFECFGGRSAGFDADGAFAKEWAADVPAPHRRTSPFLEQEVFAAHRTETEILRYIRRLESRDLSLTTSMIPLGSCTMKLNATTEMMPVTWPSFASIHPFAPPDQARGYAEMISRLEGWLAEICGFAAVSMQPNAGSQGEYAGLLAIRAYHASRGEGARDVCLIPTSAHGTNPASAVLAGLEIASVGCDVNGNVDLHDLRKKADERRDRLAALMVTYPSTHGVFEESIRDICRIVHDRGGLVYLDGANMNAMVGVSRPGDFGADVCHLNLHKTFCIPHGGGGPGMGPIAVASKLAPFLPRHPLARVGGEKGIGAVSSAPWGSPGVLPIPFAYIAMMGADGLARATGVAILAANYVARRLDPHFPVLFKGANGLVAHECIVDVRPISKKSGVEVEDVAKRLMDYGFHAPTVSFPVPGTLMIEPTESESLAEIDRFCDAMISIREEIREIEDGRADRARNLLKGAPHTAEAIAKDSWDRPYSRERAAFPLSWVRERKFWPAVGRIDSVHGDRNLVCCWVPGFGEAR